MFGIFVARSLLWAISKDLNDIGYIKRKITQSIITSHKVFKAMKNTFTRLSASLLNISIEDVMDERKTNINQCFTLIHSSDVVRQYTRRAN